MSRKRERLLVMVRGDRGVWYPVKGLGRVKKGQVYRLGENPQLWQANDNGRVLAGVGVCDADPVTEEEKHEQPA
jgi:hypothetical protein